MTSLWWFNSRVFCHPVFWLFMCYRNLFVDSNDCVTNPSHGSNSWRESRSWECLLCRVGSRMIGTVPFAALLHSQAQHATVPLQEVTHVIISACESSRAGNSSTVSSDISHGNQDFASSLVCGRFLVSWLLQKGCVRKKQNKTFS